MLQHYDITREQLIDLAMLVGTDFNDGIKGIGPKKALKLVRDFGSMENMPAEMREGIIRFLCDEREFSRERVTAALERAFQ